MKNKKYTSHLATNVCVCVCDIRIDHHLESMMMTIRLLSVGVHHHHHSFDYILFISNFEN